VSVDHRKILLVEDNPNDEALLMRALQKAGITNPIVRAKTVLKRFSSCSRKDVLSSVIRTIFRPSSSSI